MIVIHVFFSLYRITNTYLDINNLHLKALRYRIIIVLVLFFEYPNTSNTFTEYIFISIIESKIKMNWYYLSSFQCLPLDPSYFQLYFYLLLVFMTFFSFNTFPKSVKSVKSVSSSIIYDFYLFNRRVFGLGLLYLCIVKYKKPFLSIISFNISKFVFICIGYSCP